MRKGAYNEVRRCYTRVFLVLLDSYNDSRVNKSKQRKGDENIKERV